MKRASGFVNRTFVVGGSLVAASVLWSAAALQAVAAVPTPTGFSVELSPSARLLDAWDDKLDGTITSQQYYDIKYEESCDNPHLRIRARNKPSIMITNYGTPLDPFNSAAPITSVQIAINEGPYIFGMGDTVTDGFTNFIKNTIYNDPGVSVTGSSVSADMKTLTVNLSGLTAGKRVIFGVDLDTTDPGYFMYPDYRAVLFGAPLDDETDPTDPATISAKFGTDPDSKTLSLTLEQQLTPPDWMNEHIRPYHAMDTMEHDGGSTGVPEPTGLIMGAAGVLALALRRRVAA
jgi:hypothetical protein